MSDTNDIRRSHAMKRLALAAIAAGTVVAAPSAARADTVSPTGKGITGGALLGGEIVVFGEGIFGVRSPAAYLVGAGAGAVAGGVGGYFIEQSVDDGRIPAYMLAGGLALIIPAVVVALDQTRYMPAEGAREDRPVTNLPPADPGRPGGSSVEGTTPAAAPAPAPAAAPAPANPGDSATPPPATPPAPAPGGAGTGGTPAPQSLIDVHQGAFRVGMPVPSVRPVFSMAERKALGVTNPGNEFRFPVVHVVF
jgi:hypothetical protein